MRIRTLGLLLGSAALAAATGALLVGDAPAAPSDHRFVVHEWGTFTSMQGSDGVVLEGLTREEERLPDFVYSRSEVRDCPLRDKGWKGLEVPADHVTQKMETPVLYFHSTTPRRVRVRVDFVGGLISQWYPVSDLLGPPEQTRDAGPLDVSKIDRSFLQWDVEVRPEGEDAPKGVPHVADDDPWSFARDVKASWLTTLPRKGPERSGPSESERYLFYRGLGNFPLPLRVEVDDRGVFVVHNEGDAEIESPIVLDVKGDRGRMRTVESIPPGGGRKTQLLDEHWASMDDVENKLKALVSARLVATGLHEDEARAMVRTWSRSWFRSEGTRVLWILPRGRTDALLPLSIDPEPDSLVRVLVARTEVITPEAEEADYAALLDGQSKDAARVERGVSAMKRLDRFLEPHLRRVIAKIDARKDAPRPTDELIRGEAASWLGKLVAGEENPFRR